MQPRHASAVDHPGGADPRVSVVMIFLNAERFIEEAVESVVAQTYSRWELIFVDDGSTDGSSEIARGYAARHPDRMRYLEHPGHQNRGMSASRNLGIRHARGEYVALLDADDVYLPDKLERQVGILDAHPEAAMVYGATRHWFGWTGRPEDQGRDRLRTLGVAPDTLVPPPVLVPLFLQGQAETPGTCAVLIRRAAAEAVGGFEERFRGMYEDQVFFFKICLAASVYVESGTSDLYRQHERSALHAALDVGEYHTERESFASRRFLHWLHEYVAARGIEHPGIREVLARDLWPVSDGLPTPGLPQRAIAPVPSGGTRPLWSVMIPVHDGAEHLSETLAAVLAQDPGPDRMQIEVVDARGGPDDVAGLVRDLGRGRVGFFRQPNRGGYAAALNLCLERSRGHLVHLLDSRDTVVAGCYQLVQGLFDTHPELGAAFCRTRVVDGHGARMAAPPPLQERSGALDRGYETVAALAPVERSAMLVRRAVYEHLGGFDERFPWGGYDAHMWLRIAAHYPIGYEATPLVLRRDSKDTLARIVARAADAIRSVDAMQPYLPPDSASVAAQFEREHTAVQALRDSRDAIRRDHPRSAAAQTWELLRSDHWFSMMSTVATHASGPVEQRAREKLRHLRDRFHRAVGRRLRRTPTRPEELG